MLLHHSVTVGNIPPSIVCRIAVALVTARKAGLIDSVARGCALAILIAIDGKLYLTHAWPACTRLTARGVNVVLHAPVCAFSAITRRWEALSSGAHFVPRIVEDRATGAGIAC